MTGMLSVKPQIRDALAGQGRRLSLVCQEMKRVRLRALANLSTVNTSKNNGSIAKSDVDPDTMVVELEIRLARLTLLEDG